MKTFDSIFHQVARGERIDSEAAMNLIDHVDLLDMGKLASQVKHRLHPAPIVTYVVDRNINYTNVCLSGCHFCAFYRGPDHPEAYVLSHKKLEQKIEETIRLGGTQILLQGGMHPDLYLKDMVTLLQFIKSRFDIHIHGFSPPEIFDLAQKEGQSVTNVLQELINAGLGSIPGGGAEILVDRVRQKISPNKCSADQWLNVMRSAHHLGLRTTATMMFGHMETNAEIISHLLKLRDLQDETGGFTAFIPWPFQPQNTRIQVKPATSVDYLKVLAISRVVLDNIDNIQASWVTQGAKIAQMALAFGANDFGSTMIEENVVAAAGVHFRLPEDEIIRLITNAGFSAAKRDCFYQLVSTQSRPKS